MDAPLGRVLSLTLAYLLVPSGTPNSLEKLDVRC